MVMPMSVNDNALDLEQAGWRLVPYNVTFLEAPPTTTPDFRWVDPEGLGDQAEITLAGGHQRGIIDQETHRGLLDQSLTQYEGIWRDLAGR